MKERVLCDLHTREVEKISRHKKQADDVGGKRSLPCGLIYIMPEELDDLLKRIGQKHLNQPPQPGAPDKRPNIVQRLTRAVVNFLEQHRKIVTISLAALMLVLVGVMILAQDYLTKRQSFPERNVLYRSTNVLYIAGGSEMKGTANIDTMSETQVYEGGVESKVGT